ncbi:MAG: hypothetical protein DMG02_34135 [Acidobacteria bacterium]|nr:MAG: hypothetical protein DMG02_34135 [Acidobacteriota bacterium]
MNIPVHEWEWFGSPGHLIVARDCRFHLCTLIGEYLVSTVGQYLPDSQVREILATTRGIALDGRGDARLADYMTKIGYEEIGSGRLFETMVFKTTGERCTAKDCACGLPTIDPSDLLCKGYMTAGAATKGHRAICARVAAGHITDDDEIHESTR